MNAHKRLFLTWLASLAIVLNALMPTLSLAFDAGRTPDSAAAGDWIEVCSVSGASWVLLDGDGQLLARTSQKPEGALASADEGHCPYCLTHAASFGLPPASNAGVLAWWGMADRLPQPAAPLQKQLIWLTPAARAPPHKL